MSLPIEIKTASLVLSGFLAAEAGSAINQPQRASASAQEQAFIGRSILDPRLVLVPEAQTQPVMLQEAASRLSFEINGVAHTLEAFQGARGEGINAGKVRYSSDLVLRNTGDGTEQVIQPNSRLHDLDKANYGYRQDEMIDTFSTAHIKTSAGRFPLILCQDSATFGAELSFLKTL